MGMIVQMFGGIPPLTGGCLDSDGDLYSDEADEFPNDPTENRDWDEDGVGDNADYFPWNALEWEDSDGDGRGDNSDWDIYDPYEWQDSDGDGVGDNADVYPDDSRRSAEGDMLEPGKQFFLVVIVFLSAIVILYPKGLKNTMKRICFEQMRESLMFNDDLRISCVEPFWWFQSWFLYL